MRKKENEENKAATICHASTFSATARLFESRQLPAIRMVQDLRERVSPPHNEFRRALHLLGSWPSGHIVSPPSWLAVSTATHVRPGRRIQGRR
jgi:hypothetical protein